MNSNNNNKSYPFFFTLILSLASSISGVSAFCHLDYDGYCADEEEDRTWIYIFSAVVVVVVIVGLCLKYKQREKKVIATASNGPTHLNVNVYNTNGENERIPARSDHQVVNIESSNCHFVQPGNEINEPPPPYFKNYTPSRYT